MKSIQIVLSVAMAAGVCLAQETAKHVKNVTHGIVCCRPGDTFGYFAWPSIAKQEDGTLCVVASGLRRGHVCPWGRTIICKSKDNGKTWTYPQVINNSPLDDRDAGIISLGGQRLAVTWFTSNTYYLYDDSYHKKNEDGTWQDPQVGNILDGWTDELVEKESGAFVRVSNDGEYWGDVRPTPVNSPHGFIVLRDGSWLYFAKLWQFMGKGLHKYFKEAGAPIVAARSTDEGRTWEVLGEVPTPKGVSVDICTEAHVIELQKDGELLGAVRVERGKPFSTMITRSKDGGKTWSVLEDIGCDGAPPHLLRHSSGAIICVYGIRRKGYGQRCMISYDDGQTWDKNIIIRDDGDRYDLGYPASVELADGSIFTVYYQYLPGRVKASILWSKWELPDREPVK